MLVSGFPSVGPLVDGHVEIPFDSGVRFAADGMLSQHPDYQRVLEGVIAQGHNGVRDVPVVLDRWAPIGTLYHCGDVAFVNRKGMKIERVFVVDVGSARSIFEDMMKRQNDELRAQIERDVTKGRMAVGLSGWLPDDTERKRIEGKPLETFPNGRPKIEISRDAETPTDFHLVCTTPGHDAIAQLVDRPCYRCDARTDVTGVVPLCARCRAET